MTDGAPGSAWMVVSDLDGCLLDAETYSWEAAAEALSEIARMRVPLVLCSSKTRAEMTVLSAELGLVQPFIVENGGAIVFPAGSFPGAIRDSRTVGDARVLALGVPRAALVAGLRELAREAGVRVRGFADMSVDEIRDLTGLSGPAAAQAAEREYDEPFVIDNGTEILPLARAAARRGFLVSRGGRFFHFMGGSDKGLAVRTLLAALGRTGRAGRSAGLGDAETDLSFLRSVDRPIVVPRPDGSLDPRLHAELPEAERAEVPGPVGWNAAVLAVLRGQPLRRLGAPQSR